MGNSKMSDKVCPDCNGNGTVWIKKEYGEIEIECDYCDGEGVVGMDELGLMPDGIYHDPDKTFSRAE